LGGEGGPTRSGETDEGAAAQKIPHPSAALTPSPTRGEGRAGGTRMLPRHRYTKNGENIDNITDRALKQFPPAYGKHLPSPLAGEGGSTRSGETDEGWPRKRSLIRQLR
ncbi:MAG: hypothetical protein ABJN75_21755, partial [Hoeflea sp.]|uniref:hypothetical protein n=1 Tax=Hoeflea sp. TaxID=1940281 RepID=UPI00329A14FD